MHGVNDYNTSTCIHMEEAHDFTNIHLDKTFENENDYKANIHIKNMADLCT